ncbi:MAG: ROK family protein [Candidatus Gastranaerophilales bacterium]|nr:ROK family protein [Candidatus Gastranaerophilales bacterium]
MAKKYNIGVDIGGTNVKIALIDEKGHIAYSNSVPTRAEMGYEYSINNIITTIRESLKESNNPVASIGGIGFGLPGQIDSVNGIVRILPNVPGWIDVPLAKMVQKEFNVPVKMDNDVRVATLGELNFGAGIGCKNLICLTVGTGVGSGIVLNGQLVRGASMSAGEIGHVMVERNDGAICGCGSTGCLEAYASGPSIVKMAKEYIAGGKSTKYKEIAAGNELTPYMVYEAAKQGDAVAIRIFTIVGEYLGSALVSVVNLLNPERIIVGGGVGQAGDLLLNPIREIIRKRCIPTSANAVEIVPAQLGESAGVVGASILVEQK